MKREAAAAGLDGQPERSVSPDRMEQEGGEGERTTSPNRKRVCVATAEEVDKLIDTIAEYKRREYVYLARSIQQEKDLQRLAGLVFDWRINHEQMDGSTQVRGCIIDPAVNMELRLLRERLQEKDEAMRKLQTEVDSAGFDPNSVTGRRLINKCKTLQEENADLGKLLAEGALQDVQLQVNAQKHQSERLKNRLKEEHEFSLQMDEEIEKLHSTVAELSGKLKTAREEKEALEKRVQELEAERAQ
eukprot:GDKI01025522.1.p1 GENE.GDKI01025522.1~~GDKI01025522.1.p1  ORF type:complete len:245 (-),score=68.56 GDKI01025522.1:250-984(-)